MIIPFDTRLFASFLDHIGMSKDVFDTLSYGKKEATKLRFIRWVSAVN